MTTTTSDALARVLQVIDRLLDPETGCPWDLKQTPETIRRYLLEETYELLAAVEANQPEDVLEETGDCLFLLFFLTRLFQDRGHYDLARVLETNAAKMIYRHPHVFKENNNINNISDDEAVREQWHKLKRKEKKGSLVEGIPEALPALLRTHRITERAGRVGFDWTEPEPILESLSGEIEEMKQALADQDREAIAHELGDVLFTLVNLARHLKISAEDALRATNTRFVSRFQYIEEKLEAQGRTPEEADLEEMDRLWDEAKKEGL